VGAAYFAIYYLTFGWCIRRFGLATPGREPTDETPVAAPGATDERGGRFIAALGGSANLTSIDACTTRLRLSVTDTKAVDEAALRALGARGIVYPGGDSVQVVLGPIADQVASEIRAAAAAASTSQASKPELVDSIADALRPAGIRSVESCGSRLLIDLDDPSRISASALDRLDTRGWVIVSGGIQIIIGSGAEAAALSLATVRA
jgi:PTS system N-acetylglucosamine-specific IIC component